MELQEEVIINQIVEPTCELYLENELVGQITGSLQLNDCLIQIKRGNLKGYFLKYNEIIYPIEPTGRIYSRGAIYPLLSKQLKEILGF